jgi:poly-gamma-glutamate capsule biosynthesis protein CapA/YwtB (metallophosphatase superfamily)
MSRPSQRRARGRRWTWLCAVFLGASASAQTLSPANPDQRANAPVDANRPYAQELRSSAATDLVITVAGSLAITTAAGTLPAWDPKVTEIVNGKAFPATSSVAVADLQTTLIDPTAFTGYPYAWDSARVYAAPVRIAGELKRQGLLMLAVANGHTLDWGIEGMRATGAALDEAGLKHAGTGDREALARMASFLDEPDGKGRIALLAMGTSYRPTTNALSPRGAAPGRPGISALELRPLRLVPPPQRTELQRIACRFQHPDDPGHCEHLPPPSPSIDLFGNRFVSGVSAGDDYSSQYELNRVQVANELHSIREAKQNSDVAMLLISTGQLDRSNQTSAVPSAALVQFAHAAIEAGADLVAAAGSPNLGPIEIYRPGGGPPRPVLYGVGVFCWTAEAVAPADLPDLRDAIIVRNRIEPDRVSLEIYPVDLRAPGAPRGLPQLADAERGRAILEQLRVLSAPYHTDIKTETYGATVRGVIAISWHGVAATGGNP